MYIRASTRVMSAHVYVPVVLLRTSRRARMRTYVNVREYGDTYTRVWISMFRCLCVYQHIRPLFVVCCALCCQYTYACSCVYTCMCLCVYAVGLLRIFCVSMRLQICIHACASGNMCVCYVGYARTHDCLWIRVYMYARACVCVCVFIVLIACMRV